MYKRQDLDTGKLINYVGEQEAVVAGRWIKVSSMPVHGKELLVPPNIKRDQFLGRERGLNNMKH